MPDFEDYRILAKLAAQADQVAAILWVVFERPGELGQERSEPVPLRQGSDTVFEFLFVERSRLALMRKGVEELGSEPESFVTGHALEPLLCGRRSRRAIERGVYLDRVEKPRDVGQLIEASGSLVRIHNTSPVLI